jgi:hypothetical protein
VRYNFWTQDKYLARFPEEASDVRVLHYLNGPFRKHDDTNSITDVQDWVARRSDSSDPVERLLADALTMVLSRIAARACSQGAAVG